MKNNSPCVGCPKAGCGSYHDKCEKYVKFRKEREEIYAKKKDASIVYGLKSDMHLKRVKELNLRNKSAK